MLGNIVHSDVIIVLVLLDNPMVSLMLFKF